MNIASTLPSGQALVTETEATLQTMALPCLSVATAVAAALVCCAATPVLAHDVNSGSVRVLMALLTLPLWLCLLVVVGASLVAGAFDALTPHRSLQAAGVLVAVSLLAYLIGRGALAQQSAPLLVLPPLALAAAAGLRWWPRA